MSTPAGYDEAHAAAERLADLTGTDHHEAVVVLGSGWGPAADAFGEQVAAFPPCDTDLDQVDGDEVAADLAADLALERSLEDIRFAEGWS